MLAAEKELLGFYVTGHPLTPYAALLQKFAVATTAQLPQLPPRSMTRLGGMVAAVQEGVSKRNGKPYALVTLEDLHGSISVLCTNETYEKYRDLLVPAKLLLVVGEVNLADDKAKLFPLELLPLEDAPRRYTKQVHLRLPLGHLNPERLAEAHSLVRAHHGTCPLFLCLTRPTGEIVFIEAHERFRVAPSLDLQRSVDERFGEGTYYAKVDLRLPERPRRQWERRPDAAGGED
jgi:DNA polymerase-3 subunit alpha